MESGMLRALVLNSCIAVLSERRTASLPLCLNVSDLQRSRAGQGRAGQGREERRDVLRREKPKNGGISSQKE
eukprot:2541374-Heterocapsa_arctica.AAC.1